MKLIALIVVLVGSVAVGQTTQPYSAEEARKDYQSICERAKANKVAELESKCDSLRKAIKKESNATRRKQLRAELKETEKRRDDTKANPPPGVPIEPARVGDVGELQGTFTLIQILSDNTALASYSVTDQVEVDHSPSGMPIYDYRERHRRETYLLKGFVFSEVADGAKLRPYRAGFVSGQHTYTNTRGAQVTALVVEPL